MQIDQILEFLNTFTINVDGICESKLIDRISLDMEGKSITIFLDADKTLPDPEV